MPNFPELWSSVDQEKVAAAIGPELLPDYDFEDAKLCVYAAAERWLERDLEEFYLDGIEQLHRSDDPRIVELGGYKAYFDLVGRMTGACKQFAPYAGAPFIVDWKSASVALDTTWKERQLTSEQWKAYAAISGVRLFFYRGIRRPNNLKNGCETKELIIEIPEYNYEDITTNILAKLRVRDFLIENKLPIWPRNMPAACHEFRRVCPYFDDCDTFAMPRQGLDIGPEMSYTRLKTFTACPERYRRDMLLKEEGVEDEDDSENLIFGRAFHRGIAEVYSQIFNVPCGVREK